MDAAPSLSGVSPPWRLAVFILATAVGVLLLRTILPLVTGFVAGATGAPVATYTYVWTLAGGLLIGHAWTFRLVEPRGWSYVGLGRSALRPDAVALGAVFGAAAIGAPVLLLLGVGWLDVHAGVPGSSTGAAAGLLPLLVPAALWEELLMRGFLFAVLRERWGTWGALAATSVVFGLLHLQNEGATPQSVGMVTIAGVFLGAVLVRTGSLYAAWAAHLAWNFMLAAVAHAAVSGLWMRAPDYRVVDAGPDWATGGAWGPEGGLVAGLGMLVSIGLLFRRPRGRTEDET
jgi:membrane protease YdiL (CAAX protease family)